MLSLRDLARSLIVLSSGSVYTDADGRTFDEADTHEEFPRYPVPTETLAELIWLAAERPGRRALNAGDPAPPRVLEISRAIAAALDHEWTEVLLPGAVPPNHPSGTPWSAPRPFVMDMTEAEFEL